MGYVIGLGLQIIELKSLFQSDIPPKSVKSTTLATTIFLFSVFVFCMYASNRKQTFMERWVNGSQLAKMKKSKTTAGYSYMREGPVSLLSSHPNKHELEPAELCPVR